MQTVPIDSIVVADRCRKDLGDVRALADSIKAVGLLHLPVVTGDRKLVAGERRLAAMRLLGWTETPVHEVATLAEAADLLRAERDENTCRKDLSPSEAVAIGERIESVLRPQAEARREATQGRPLKTGGNFPPVSRDGFGNPIPDPVQQPTPPPAPPKTRDAVGASVGMSGKTYEKAKAVVEAARAEPEKYEPLVEQMDTSGKVDRAFKTLRTEQRRREAEAKASELTAAPDWSTSAFRLIHADVAEGLLEIEDESVDFVITDPPYPQEYLHTYSDLSKLAARVLKPGGSLLAMTGEMYLPEVITRLSECMTYHWTVAYLTPGGQAVQVWPRKVNAFWKPVLWYVKGEYTGDWVGDVTRSAVNDNDKRHHDWGQSESGMADLIERFTKPGDTILDPFVGGGTTAVVAVSMARYVIAADVDQKQLDITAGRLAQMAPNGRPADGNE
ncbi:MAG: Modification methylase DpnIIB [Firmicutes bacterium ADurb.Bin506]|nr:MAG: Modification methylase DpnIIB [Firmicutes bacterium ADurb.Bin506]